MKKLFAMALAVIMVVSMATVASAESTTTLTTEVPAATYTLNIPASQEIPFGATKTDIGNITVTDASGFAAGKNLAVTVEYDAFTAEGISTQIPYTLSLYAEGNSMTNNAYHPATMELPTGTTVTFKGKDDGTLYEKIKLNTSYTQGSNTLDIPVTCVYFNANSEDWGKALAGEYTTTITFTCEVVVE